MNEVKILLQLQEHGLYDAYVERKMKLTAIFKLNRKEIIAIQYVNQADVLNDLTD